MSQDGETNVTSSKANLHKRQQQLRYANPDQINAVSELLMNTLRGIVPKGRMTLRRLKPYAEHLRIIANPQQSIKRRLMMHQLGGTVWKELRRCYHCVRKQFRN